MKTFWYLIAGYRKYFVSILVAYDTTAAGLKRETEFSELFFLKNYLPPKLQLRHWLGQFCTSCILQVTLQSPTTSLSSNYSSVFITCETVGEWVSDWFKLLKCNGKKERRPWTVHLIWVWYAQTTRPIVCWKFYNERENQPGWRRWTVHSNLLKYPSISPSQVGAKIDNISFEWHTPTLTFPGLQNLPTIAAAKNTQWQSYL